MRVVVVGSGISGLTSALRLCESGHDVVVLSASSATRSTSHLAAAVWFPTAVGPSDRVPGWARTTYDAFVAESAGRVPGVILRDSLALYRDDPGEPEWTRALDDVQRVPASGLPLGYAHGLRFTVPLVEMPRYLPHLVARVRDAGAEFRTRSVTRLDDVLDLGPALVVNAAGMAAGALAGDTSTYPIRGQIVRVANPGLRLSVRDEGHPAGRAYVHPRTEDCILGGTLDRDEWDTTPDPLVTESIIARCTDLVPALAGQPVLDVVVGLRPGRPEVRLEFDDALLPVPVVHNYGHGGAGITVSWGCAGEVTGLVDGVA